MPRPASLRFSFEDADEGVFTCEVCVNVFAFTETDAGIFFVNRKRVDIDLEVAFDARGGTLDKSSLSFKLGAMYSSLPKPTWTGYTFLGWFTKAEGGVEVVASDRCKTGVTALFAHWEVYVDPFVDAICPAKDMTFFSEGASPWTADGESARSGVIADGGLTSLTTTVQGKGTFAFKWKASSEAGYDGLLLSVDGAEKERISGESGDWLDGSVEIGADGSHDVAWSESDGTEESFASSNGRFRRNGLAVARAAFARWRPRRYKVMWDAVKFARVCQRFGWGAWRAPYEARQSREGRAPSRPQEGGAA